MKVLHIIPTLNKGGAERICLDIVRESRKRDHTVNIVTLSAGNDYKTEYPDITPIVIDSVVRPSVLRKWETDLHAWDKRLDDERPDVIHSHLFQAEMVSRYSVREGIRYFTHCHDNMLQLKNLSWHTIFNKSLLTTFYEKSFMIGQYRKCNNNFIAISRDTEIYFNNVLPVPLSRNITLLHNAIDFSVFNRANSARKPFPLNLVNIGSFVPKKNQMFLVEVVKKLSTMGADARLTLLGDGPLITEVRKTISAYSLDDRICTPGIVDNVPEHLAKANVYVHSASYEPFGLVLVEAMASGLPVVSIDGGGNKDLIVQGRNGYLIPKGDIESFCSALISLSQDQKLYASISDQAVEFARERNIQVYVDRLLELYQS